MNKRYATIILITLLVSLIIVAFFLLPKFGDDTNKKLISSFRAIPLDNTYQQVHSDCIADGFQSACSFNFYTSKDQVSSTRGVLVALKSQGYTVKKMTNGLDSPDAAYLARNSTRNAVIIFKEITRGNNINYERKNGNVQFRVYLSDQTNDNRFTLDPQPL